MMAQVLAFFAHYLAQPLFNPGVVYVVVVHPALVASVVGRINLDALDLPLIPGQQSLERLQIVPTDNHVFARLGVVCILFLQYPVGDLQVMVDYVVLADPFKCGHKFLSCLRYSKANSASVNLPLFFMRLFKHDLKVAFAALFAASLA